MRRTAVRLLSITAVPLVLLTGCGSDSKPKTATSLSDLTVNTSNADKPTVTIPKGGFKAGSQTATQVLTQGTGPTIGAKQIAYVDYVAYNATKNKQLVSTFGQRFVPIPLADTTQLPGLVKSLVGKKVGTTQKVAIPASQGFGSAGNSTLGVSATDTLVFYIKIDGAADALTQPTGTQATPQDGFKVSVPAGTNKQATITVPATAPKTLLIQPLIKGSGIKTATGDFVTVSYTGVNLRTKKVFDASAKTGQSATFQLSTGAIAGFVKGLTGQTVGSRVLISIPPAEGYGSAGQAQAGIKGTDTIAFVVDILAIVPQPPQQQQQSGGN
ncbi:FKBP-type peptidyl-prolyl cis-trans isomerase [Allobranchiibius sp. GilTou73]|uniref:FKBP-type peptidyl-prolyl cis-trans isomerase n=1 Tax=Allobranchiibius sp. GilTou73 TaxID=2904523 RepID=UPI001F308F39|nr:FKBP-type peptidyl-prolyl cis-trans isomerase [Allobranchiibius sp. GilTou73]UIJ33984.1 FKBP-type peptidyl-prolyl cis-trans isomerase [Allobranchiibius sp. GilTou73]